MLHRETDTGYLAITQPAHAWVSQQLAAAWGNAMFGDLQPREDVILAAGQHDIGWLGWELEPVLNPETGRGQTFTQISTADHLDIWTPAGPAALVYGPYVAMLVSMHGTRLYGFHDFSRDTEEEAARARAFLNDGPAFEQRMIEQMRDVPRYAPFLDDATVRRNSTLIAAWDRISLFICSGKGDPFEASDVPASDGSVSINFTPDSAHVDRLSVDPWPFSTPEVKLTCPAREFTGTFTTQDALLDAMHRAPWTAIEVTLLPVLCAKG